MDGVCAPTFAGKKYSRRLFWHVTRLSMLSERIAAGGGPPLWQSARGGPERIHRPLNSPASVGTRTGGEKLLYGFGMCDDLGQIDGLVHFVDAAHVAGTEDHRRALEQATDQPTVRPSGKSPRAHLVSTRRPGERLDGGTCRIRRERLDIMEITDFEADQGVLPRPPLRDQRVGLRYQKGLVGRMVGETYFHAATGRNARRADSSLDASYVDRSRAQQRMHFAVGHVRPTRQVSSQLDRRLDGAYPLVFHVGVRLYAMDRVIHGPAADLARRDFDARRLADDRETRDPSFGQQFVDTRERSGSASRLLVRDGLNFDVAAQLARRLCARHAGDRSDQTRLHVGRAEAVHPTLRYARLQRIDRPAVRGRNRVDVAVQQHKGRSSPSPPFADHGEHPFGRRGRFEPVGVPKRRSIDEDPAHGVGAHLAHHPLDELLRRRLLARQGTRRDQSGKRPFDPSPISDHCLIPTRKRSSKTASMMMTPDRIFMMNEFTPIRLKPFWRHARISAPKRVPNTLPLPPNRLEPPRMTAAIASSSNPSADVGRPAPRRPSKTTAARPHKAPLITKIRNLV